MDNTLNIESKTDEKQYIAVEIGVELYGIDINYVDNIVRMQKVTRVPKSQPYFNGVINLRGEIIPVMSIRKRFELEADTFTDKTRIIILKPDQQDPIGVIVDVVKEVVVLNEADVEKITSEGGYISGVGKKGDSLISILNINNVINDNNTNPTVV